MPKSNNIQQNAAAISHPENESTTGDKSQTLLERIQPYTEVSFVDLPEPLRKHFGLVGGNVWDLTSPSERIEKAREYDTNNNPAKKKEAEYWFDLFCRVDALKETIAEWESMHHQGIPSEAEIKERKLSGFRAELARLESLWEHPPFANVGMLPDAIPAARPKIETPPISHPSTTGKRTAHKLRKNSLDTPIDKAIMQAGKADTGAVFLKLRELALNSETPFTGGVEGDALCYTKDNNSMGKFTKNALRKRLKNRA